MKLIKKIAAIMFAFMMVVSMSCNVKAVEGTTPTTGETGTITINNAIEGQTYSIYKILELESYDEINGLYSYKPTAEWKNFLNTEEAKMYVGINVDGYVTGASGFDNSKAAEFAKLALAYKENPVNSITETVTSKNATGNTVTFSGLGLGYYLVDSSAGSLCSLDTTNPNVDITEKNKAPTVTKKVYVEQDLKDSNSAMIGDKVYFETTITVPKGTTKLVLKDQMGEGLKLFKNEYTGYGITSHAYYNNGSSNIDLNKDTDYTLKIEKDAYGTETGFTIDFATYIKQHKDEEYNIKVHYSVVVTSKAKTKNENKTWVEYGDNNTHSNESNTITYTFSIPVFKYTGNNEPLEGVEFQLFTDATNEEAPLTFINSGSTYRYEKGANPTLKSDSQGKFTVSGLKAGTYWLKETKTLDGYNLLSKKVKIEIKDDGKIYVEDGATPSEKVEVLNNHGSLLPSTGGMGTTLIYLIGGALVLGSGIVLVNKKRAKAK